MSTSFQLHNNTLKELPHNIEAEQAVIGSILVSNDIFDEISTIISSINFYDPMHQKIFEAIESLIYKGMLANPITLKNYFEDEKDDLNVPEYLVKITKFSTSVRQAVEYSKIIYDITSILITENQFLNFFIISSSCLCFSIIFFYKKIIRQLSTQLVLLVLLSILFYLSDLMLSFAVYFVFWHSIPSIVEQTNYIFGQNNYKSFIKYFKKAFIYWVVSMIGLIVFFYFLKDNQSLLISVFFSFLAAITLPHTLVIFRIKIK